jgi:cytochrome d ubiquinol oxidase subunit I
MELDPVILSRIQFGFVIAFHIIFPAFTIGLAAWLATIEGMRLATGNPLYRRVFDFWLKVFALSFGMGVVTGIVMAFQFGTNWNVLAENSGPIQGPLLGYEAFTAFILEATFFGVMLLGRERAPPWFYFFACCMVSLGTMLSSFWILCNNSWMQVPLGHVMVDGKFVPDNWWPIVTGPIVRIRWPHMLFACFLTTGMSVIAAGAWYLLRDRNPDQARVMLRWGVGLVAVIIPVWFSATSPTSTSSITSRRNSPRSKLAGTPSSRPARCLSPSRMRPHNATYSPSRCRGSAASSRRAPGMRVRSDWTRFRRRTARRCSSGSGAFA